LVYISTDYVFAGEKGMYKEQDELLPQNKYAWSKLGGECAVQMLDNYVIIRLSFGPDIFPYKAAFNNSNNTSPAIPYLMIVDDAGNDVSKKYMDDEITKPLTFEQINWVGETWQTGFIYHTFADIDNDNISEIFPASGIGYKKDNSTYYYKFKDNKYKLEFYHNNWFGDVHKSKGYINYKPFVDEKNKVNVFLPVEGNLLKAVFKTF
jgi:hypothetical protein